MPLYDLVCEDCRRVVEAMLAMEEPPPPCSCGGRLFRAMSVVCVRFVQNENGGTGWSSNGYRTFPKDEITVSGKTYGFPHKTRKTDGKVLA